MQIIEILQGVVGTQRIMGVLAGDITNPEVIQTVSCSRVVLFSVIITVVTFFPSFGGWFV